ncbi:hypothetical protein [Salinisphaera sp. T31B1]|uniref:hypothetical protein n=1 Tax=Salinisphaera sp. T31B1 TaxID=727963 RepID=UPI003340894B
MRITLLCLLAIAALLSGCASSGYGPGYGRVYASDDAYRGYPAYGYHRYDRRSGRIYDERAYIERQRYQERAYRARLEAERRRHSNHDGDRRWAHDKHDRHTDRRHYDRRRADDRHSSRREPHGRRVSHGEFESPRGSSHRERARPDHGRGDRRARRRD